MPPDVRLVANDRGLYDAERWERVTADDLLADGVRAIEIAPRSDSAWARDWSLEFPFAQVTLVSAVVPKVAAFRLRPPLRYLTAGDEIGMAGDGIRLAAAACHEPRSIDLAAELRWPTIDVLEIPLRVEDVADGSALVDHDDDRPPRLGWLERAVTRWRTRLLVLTAEHVGVARPARVLAGRLADRGGPLVVVAVGDWLDRDTVLDHLADGRPFDELDVPAGGHGRTVIGGRGRERLFDLGPILRDYADFARERGLPGPRPWYEGEGEGDLAVRPDVAAASVHSLQWAYADLADAVEPAVEETAVRDVHVVLDSDDGPVRGHDHLVPGRTYTLEVAVGAGPRDATLVDAESPLEHLLPPGEGVWAEVAITPIDVAVTGSLTQQLWIPPFGPGPPAVFELVVAERDLVAFRITIYVAKRLLRSYRVVARTTDEGDVVDRQAEALVVPRDQLGDLAWAMREEYSAIGDIGAADPGDRTDAGVSIVVNLLDGRSVASVNRRGGFSTSVDAGLPAHALEIRRRLFDLEMFEPDGPYRFPDGNAGSAAIVDEQLVALARDGWNAFVAVLPDGLDRQAFRQQTDDRPVEVVETKLRADSIPWAAFYDERVHPTAAISVCHALDGAAVDGGPLPRCGSVPGCVLGDDPSLVVCPRHFWGFRTVVEQPLGGMTTEATPELVPGTNLLRSPEHAAPRAAPADTPVVRIPPPATAVVGVNADIDHAADHGAEVARALAASPWFAGPPPAVHAGDDEVYATLCRTDVGLAYLFCHAVGGELPPIVAGAQPVAGAPKLLFGAGRGLDAGAVAGDHWPAGPIVVVNGCHTGAFRPDSVSPFLVQLRGRGAGAVVLTEVSIHPRLAEEIGLTFLDLVLAGRPVGEAMLCTRRRLLAKVNPCGLLYTLYGDHRLAMAT